MTVALTDNAGTLHPFAGPAARIVSLVPSLTDLLFAMGLGHQVVGRTRFCIHPSPDVDSVPVVGGTKSVDAGKIRSTGATHILVNIDETPKPVADELMSHGLRVVVTHPNAVEDNLALYQLMAGLFGHQAEADRLGQALDRALGGIRKAAPQLSCRRVLYLIWQKPWMTVSRDTYIANVLGLVNWQTVGHDPAIRYPVIGEMSVTLQNTDLVLFSSEPFPFTEHHRTAFHRQFPRFPGQSALIDAEMVSWYGSRAIPGITYLHHFAENRQP